MKEVKEFVLEFFEKEAIAYDKLVKPNLEEFNAALKEMHTNVVPSMVGTLGMIELNKLKDDYFYEIYINEPPTVPRHLCKLSRYLDDTYGDVWVAYCSGTNPRKNRVHLTEATEKVSLFNKTALYIRDFTI